MAEPGAAPVYDLAIIGGGINGCGIARDAAGRGLKVWLCERDDLGGATSSASTKLLHGGLRYLEHREFRLVREALEEREVLWHIAPHIARPLRFVLPHVPGMRPRWVLRTGLFLYDHLGGRKALPGTATVDLAAGPLADGLREGLSTGFEYSDCWVEDNRLVVLNAQAAVALGAVVQVRTRCEQARVEQGVWSLSLRGPAGEPLAPVRARALVNAAGPWANQVAAEVAARPPKGRVRLVQGSHIVVPRLYAHDRCFIFQNVDGRIVFTIPYEQHWTLIGTTDRDHDGTLDRIVAGEAEQRYLCEAVSRYFRRPVALADVVWHYSGVRPLYDDGSEAAQSATRDYTLELDTAGPAPLLSVFGGKITTYRRLAEAAIARLLPVLGHLEPAVRERVRALQGWTGRTPLPGGDFAPQAFGAQVRALVARHPFLDEGLATRLVRYYGTQAAAFLREARSLSDLGHHFGAGLTQAEVNHLCEHEWVRTAEDLLWRRSKLGLHLDEHQRADVARYIASLQQGAQRRPMSDPPGDNDVHGYRSGNLRRQGAVDR